VGHALDALEELFRRTILLLIGARPGRTSPFALCGPSKDGDRKRLLAWWVEAPSEAGTLRYIAMVNARQC
jgi:hypothetical protein